MWLVLVTVPIRVCMSQGNRFLGRILDTDSGPIASGREVDSRHLRRMIPVDTTASAAGR
jgi:hypothetical protein